MKAIKTISISMIMIAILCSGNAEKGGILPVYGAVQSADSESSPPLFTMADAGAYDLFTNNVDGYRLSVDKGMRVDMSLSSVCAVLENGHKRIEIYKQDLRGIGKTSYINYSNRFLNNRVDHRLQLPTVSKRLGRYNVSVTAWSRGKLARVENDQNNYVCLELAEGNYIYTIFVKADAPVFLPEEYEYLARGFATFKPIVSPQIVKTAPVETGDRDWNEETELFFNAYFNDTAPLRWGIFEPRTNWLDYSRLTYYEETFSYEFTILLDYTHFQNKSGHTGLKQKLDLAYARGKTLELTLQTIGTGEGGGNMVYEILNGEYDAFLRDYAEVIADFGHPVLFRLGNEMNGDWCQYSSWYTAKDTAIFREFYRYVYGFFQEAGARNVIWIWNPNSRSYPDFQWNNELMYYPGDGYVDVIGLTAYNTGTYYRKYGEKWQRFDELYDGLYLRYLSLFGQPLMITEFASASMGGDKEEWVAAMFGHIAALDQIKVAVWWDSCDYDAEGKVSRSYVLDETPGLMDIFRKNLASN